MLFSRSWRKLLLSFSSYPYIFVDYDYIIIIKRIDPSGPCSVSKNEGVRVATLWTPLPTSALATIDGKQFDKKQTIGRLADDPTFELVQLYRFQLNFWTIFITSKTSFRYVKSTGNRNLASLWMDAQRKAWNYIRVFSTGSDLWSILYVYVYLDGNFSRELNLLFFMAFPWPLTLSPLVNVIRPDETENAFIRAVRAIFELCFGD